MARYPFLTARDIDGFFGLFVDNLVQLLLIVSLGGLCGLTSETQLLMRHVLPGAAVSILLGNIVYALLAHWLARKEGRSDVTALPYGINTPSLLVYLFFVMLPAFNQAQTDGSSAAEAARIAWLAGLAACLGSGLIELMGSLFAGWIRQHTPRAALLSTLAGIAIGFISMTFALQIFQRPTIAMLPLAVILMTYFGKLRFPWGLPGGFVAIILGTACAWIIPNILPADLAGPRLNAADVAAAWQARGWYPPTFVGAELWNYLQSPSAWVRYLSVILPMGIFNVVGSLQNIESAEAAGDRYPTSTCLAVNGVGTVVAALFGSCFPTTIYIGHPGWKELGARAGYSTLNGLVITAICLSGTVVLISRVIPIEAGVPIVLWIGIIITAQAFSATPREHAPAVAIGFFPAIAAWGVTIVTGAFQQAQGRSLQELLTLDPIPAVQGLLAEVNGFLIHGMIILERGFIFTCMILSAICVCLIEQRWAAAATWALLAAILTFAGITHAYQLQGNTIDFLLVGTAPSDGATAYPAWGLGICYVLIALVFWSAEWWGGQTNERPPE